MHAINITKSIVKMTMGILVNIYKLIKLKLKQCFSKIQGIAKPIIRKIKQKLGMAVTYDPEDSDVDEANKKIQEEAEQVMAGL